MSTFRWQKKSWTGDWESVRKSYFHGMQRPIVNCRRVYSQPGTVPLWSGQGDVIVRHEIAAYALMANVREMLHHRSIASGCWLYAFAFASRHIAPDAAV